MISPSALSVSLAQHTSADECNLAISCVRSVVSNKQTNEQCVREEGEEEREREDKKDI